MILEGERYADVDNDFSGPPLWPLSVVGDALALQRHEGNAEEDEAMRWQIVKDSPEDYYSRRALSNSGMTELLRCPARFKARLDEAEQGRADTQALLFGRLLHCIVLEPEALESRYRAKLHNGNSKEGRAEIAAAKADSVELVPEKTWHDAHNMAHALREHPVLKSAQDKESEVSVYWTELDGVVPCKARVDMLATIPAFGPVAIDIKTACDASPGELERSIIKYGYNRQAVWYLRGLRAAGRDVRAFIFLAVEKEPPHIVTAFTVSEGAQALALEDIQHCVETFAGCMSSGMWPGYTTSPIVELDVPAWAYKRKEI